MTIKGFCWLTLFWLLAMPCNLVVLCLTGTWYGGQVMGAIYQRTETGKWPKKHFTTSQSRSKMTTRQTIQPEGYTVANSIMVIKPYKYEGMWVFDDESRGLDKEALVSGVPQILQALIQNIGLDEKVAEKGFRLVFSENPFPGFHVSCKHLEEAGGDGDLGSDEVLHGNWYEVTALLTPDGNNVHQAQGMRGWLCPALFKFFDHTPKTLYVRAEKME